MLPPAARPALSAASRTRASASPSSAEIDARLYPAQGDARARYRRLPRRHARRTARAAARATSSSTCASTSAATSTSPAISCRRCRAWRRAAGSMRSPRAAPSPPRSRASAICKQAAGDRLAIVGEPIGDRLEFWAEGDIMRLPGLGALMLYATERHNYMTGCPEAGLPRLDPRPSDPGAEPAARHRRAAALRRFPRRPRSRRWRRSPATSPAACRYAPMLAPLAPEIGEGAGISGVAAAGSAKPGRSASAMK